MGEFVDRNQELIDLINNSLHPDLKQQFVELVKELWLEGYGVGYNDGCQETEDHFALLTGEENFR